MGEIARKAIEELIKSAEAPDPVLIDLMETHEDFYRRQRQARAEIIPGYDPRAENERRRRLDPLKRVPVDIKKLREEVQAEIDAQ
jgi:hypothetical protein